MNIKLISFDMDGTIYDEGYISEKTKQAFKILKDKDIILLANTGRSVHSVERIIKELGLEAEKYEAALTTGSVIQQLVSREILEQHFLQKDDYEYLKQYLTDELNLTVYGADYLYYTKKTAEFIKDAIGLEAPLKEIKSIDDFEQICRINFMGAPEKLDEFEEKFGKEIAKKYYYVRQIPTSIEILSKDSNKGNALKWIMKKYNLTKDEVLAIGDGNNDISMFEVAGISVAMANAKDNVKKFASHITDSVRDDGFYNILKKLEII